MSRTITEAPSLSRHIELSVAERRARIRELIPTVYDPWIHSWIKQEEEER